MNLNQTEALVAVGESRATVMGACLQSLTDMDSTPNVGAIPSCNQLTMSVILSVT